MPSVTVEMEWLEINELAPWDQYGGSNFCRVLYVDIFGIKVVALFQGALPSNVSKQITVTNTTFETDLIGVLGSGPAQLRMLPSGFYKWQTTWAHIHKDSQRTWKEGEFSAADYGEVYWSGDLVTSPDPQIHTGNAALENYITSSANGDRHLSFCLIMFSDGAKEMNGARLKFDYAASGAPIVSSFSPDEMNLGDTPLLTVNGSNFIGTLTSVQLVGASTYSLTSPSIVNENKITGTVPAGVAIGEYTVRVNISGQSAADSSQKFTVSNASPSISLVSSVDGNWFVKKFFKKVLTLNGSSLSGATAIEIIGQERQGTHSLTGITNVSASEIKGTMPYPPAPPGEYKLKATVSAGIVYSPVFVITEGPSWS